VPVQSIEREFFSAQIRQNYGINDGYDVYQLLSCLSHHLNISNGMIYPLPHKQPKHGLPSESSVARHQEPNNSVLRTREFLLPGCKSDSDIHCQNDVLKKDVEHDGKISDKIEEHFSVAFCDRICATDVMQNAKGNTVEGVLNLMFYCLI
jgi:hypothetical protein